MDNEGGAGREVGETLSSHGLDPSTMEGDICGAGTRWLDTFASFAPPCCWALNAAYPSDNEGTGGADCFSSFSPPLAPLNSRMNPLFLCLSDLPGAPLDPCSAGSESRRSGFTGVPLTMFCRAVFALAPVLIERARAREAMLLVGLWLRPSPVEGGASGKGVEDVDEMERFCAVALRDR